MMSVTTTYDEKRNYLRDKLTECLTLARELLDENVWGYDEMCKDYAIDVYKAIKRVRDEV